MLICFYKCAGEWLTLKLPRPITLTQVQFYARPDDTSFNQGGSNRSPGKFRLYGSHDGINWVQILDYTATKLVYPANSYRSGFVSVMQTTGYQYIGLVVSSLALANTETNVLQMMEWEINGTPYGCAQVCMPVFCLEYLHVPIVKLESGIFGYV
jgi:hypothetical protein